MLNKSKNITILCLLLFGFFIIVLRLVTLQFLQHNYYLACANRQSQYITKKEILRGSVFDRTGSVLALSIKTYSCAVRPALVEDAEQTIKVIVKCLHMPEKEVREKICSTRPFIWIKRKLDPEEVELLTPYVFSKETKLAGLDLVKENKRFYPNNNLAWHVLGKVGEDNQGLSGIERSLDTLLNGQPVEEIKTRDRLGRDIIDKVNTVTHNDSMPKNLYLTINKRIQYIVERELEITLSKHPAKQGVVIVQKPDTGEILALACRPTYTDEEWRETPKYLNNPAISEAYEPGSVFKAFTLSAGLEERVVSLSEKIFCENGAYKVFGRIITDHDRQGMLTVPQVMQYSSNIGTAKIALRLGKEKLYQYICAFGFASPTGINLPAESRGMLNSPRQWSLDSLPTICFGQEIGVTTLQLADAYSAIANGGYLMEPQIVKEVRDETGKVIWQFSPVRVRRVISEEVIRSVHDVLESVIDKGTGIKAKVVGYRTAGKTGTAQKIDKVTGKYSDTKHIATFCGFLPLPNPAVTIVIALDEIEGDDYWGGSVAAPLFSRIGQGIMEELSIIPKKEEVPVKELKYVKVN